MMTFLPTVVPVVWASSKKSSPCRIPERCALGSWGRLGFNVPAAAIKGVVRFNQFVQWISFCRPRLQTISNSKSGDLFYLFFDQSSGEAEFRDTLIEHATGFRVFFIDGSWHDLAGSGCERRQVQQRQSR